MFIFVYTYVYIYILLLPESPRYVKFLPFDRFLLVKRHRFVGIIHQHLPFCMVIDHVLLFFNDPKFWHPGMRVHKHPARILLKVIFVISTGTPSKSEGQKKP